MSSDFRKSFVTFLILHAKLDELCPIWQALQFGQMLSELSCNTKDMTYDTIIGGE